MDKNRYHRNELLAQTVIKGLESRNMTGYYAADKNEALQKALELIPEGSSITMGGCMSAQEIGLVDALQEGNYHFLDRDRMEPREALLAAYDADIFLSSVNAMTDDGILLNIRQRISSFGINDKIQIITPEQICFAQSIAATIPGSGYRRRISI